MSFWLSVKGLDLDKQISRVLCCRLISFKKSFNLTQLWWCSSSAMLCSVGDHVEDWGLVPGLTCSC